MEWWKVVQEFFLGIQKPYPSIREKAIKEDLEQLKNQIVGFASSMTALTLDKYQFDYDESVGFESCIGAVLEAYQMAGHNVGHFKKLVEKKRAKYFRNRKGVKI